MKKLLPLLFLVAAFPNLSYAEKGGYKTYTDVGELEPPGATISEVLSSRDDFHRKVFILQGRVGDLRFRQMSNGRRFTMFRFFDDDPKKRINVYARGFVEGIEKGSTVRILGRYSKHKRYFLSKRRNVMKARKIHILCAPQKTKVIPPWEKNGGGGKAGRE